MDVSIGLSAVGVVEEVVMSDKTKEELKQEISDLVNIEDESWKKTPEKPKKDSLKFVRGFLEGKRKDKWLKK